MSQRAYVTMSYVPMSQRNSRPIFSFVLLNQLPYSIIICYNPQFVRSASLLILLNFNPCQSVTFSQFNVIVSIRNIICLFFRRFITSTLHFIAYHVKVFYLADCGFIRWLVSISFPFALLSFAFLFQLSHLYLQLNKGSHGSPALSDNYNTIGI